MQGVERGDRELLDAEALVGHLVPAGSMFAFLAGHRRNLFPDGEFEDLFPSGKGRPSIPASVMASILVLQTLHDLSDRETAEAARCDLRWKVATGMALDDKGFDPSTLVYWRKRLATSGRPHRINDAVRTVVEETGILRGRRKRAVDSTILADAVATQDTITQLISAIRRVDRQVPGAAEQIAKVCTGHDYSRPDKPRIDWDDPAARDALVSALVNDANALVAALADTELEGDAEFALALLALVAGQDAEPAEGSDGTDGRWRIARKVAPDRVVSTVDPDARHTRKSPENRRDGYRAHVAAEPETGIVTDEKVTTAAGTENSDPAVAEEFLDAEDGKRAWYGDSAYGTGDLRGGIDDAGHEAVIKPKPLRAPVEGDFTVDDFTVDDFTVDDFTVDEQAGTVTCPNDITRPISRTRVATFGALCRACSLRAQCTTSKTGRKIVLHPRDDLLRQARRDWADKPELRESYRTFRPNVERVISQIASRGGRRLKLRYLGTGKNNAWLKRRTAALNLRNLIGRGLTHAAGAWTLAT
ncbi:IS1182 family transposase [Kibdelosporangium philippinense]|uniref:IS1182 family transposase n=1 Tax=Kibdelosporangium philippinense TaxID=211113 RepID=A0ABS8ZNZ0_9PSEU|nr:IS1182 family transposase [Kibdelosporangium philippinense]MCE7009262.1 IS1182 family transposase [Kibdelosporangium philippinense]